MTIPASKPASSAVDALYANLTVAAAVFIVVLEAVYFLLSGLPSLSNPSLDLTGNAVGRDFITIWMSGRSMFGYGPASLFDPKVFNDALRVMLGQNFPSHFWSYPPHMILFTWPLGLLPYLPAYVLWSVLGVAVYLLACMAMVPRKHLLFLATAPAIAVCIFFGQDGFYIAALLIGGFALLDKHPILAGLLFGILTVEPHFTILLAVVLLLTGRWWTIIAAIAMGGALMTATGYFFGTEVWADFIDKVIPQQIRLMNNGGGLLFLTVPSVLFGGRMVGLPVDLAWNLQGLVSFVALAAVIWTYWRKRDPLLSMTLFVSATFLASPYLLNSDMVIFGVLVAALRERGDNDAIDHSLALLIWSLPVVMMLSGVIYVPFAPLVLAAFTGRLLWRLSRRAQPAETVQMSATEEAPLRAAAAPQPPPETAPAALQT